MKGDWFVPRFWVALYGDLSGDARDAAIMRRVEAERRERVQPMRFDPLRAKFVDRILQGETWPDTPGFLW